MKRYSKLILILDKTSFQTTIRPLIKKILNPKYSLYKGAPAHPANIAYLINNYSRLYLEIFSKTIPAYRFIEYSHF